MQSFTLKRKLSSGPKFPCLVIVHELIPSFGSTQGTKNNMDFYQSQSAYFLEKYDGLSESVAKN